MPFKRHRVLRSSSQGEISVFDRPPSPSAFIDVPKPPPAAKTHRAFDVTTKSAPASPGAPPRAPPKSILALASPDRSTELEIDRRFGGFLETCLFCRKRLSGNDNVFMYRSVSAFCTPECRAKQIAIDEQKASRKSTKMDPDMHPQGIKFNG